ncbi:MAG TPA: ABC transporter ATP-binding protein [Vicinamibacteria bacterium]|jgi:ABC-type multidrug transport system fused ATPase/permease subunit|nr:ABC transporter ATP-binding protein [Vicinamibacteria bacterium]
MSDSEKTDSGAGPSKPERLRALLPELWALVAPRRGLLALGMGLMAVNRVSGLVLPASTKFLIDDVVGKRRIDLLGPLIAAVVAATLVQGATSFALTQVLSKAAQRLIAQMRCRVQAHVGRLRVAYFDANKTGTLVSRIMNDVEGVRNLIGTGLVEFVGGLLTAALALTVMFRLSPGMTIVTFSSLALFGAVLFRGFGTLRPSFRERGRINAEVTGRLNESLGGVRVVKGYHAEGREERVFAEGVGQILANILKTLTTTSVLSLSAAVLLGVVGAGIMFVGARGILAGELTVGGFFTYTVFLGFLVAPMFQIVSIGTQLTEALAGLERTREILREQPEDEDPRRTVVLPALRGDVVFEDVTFAYDSGKAVLEHVSFRAEPGTVTALVGPSGAGKSTMIGLLAAFHVPTAGRVLLDGVDLSTVRLDSYRTRLGVVLQETFLFDGTIRENVAFSRPEAGEEEVLAACRIARVDEFAEGFEKRYETVVGERGVKLSGGQKQRVSIARAILADPAILILDEATSSLDSESEALIQEGLSYLMRGRTTFVIAHRLSTIRRADQILVVERGRVVERGTHASLYAAGGRYFEMYTKQHGLESNLFLAPGEGDVAEDREAEPKEMVTGRIRLLGE